VSNFYDLTSRKPDASLTTGRDGDGVVAVRSDPRDEPIPVGDTLSWMSR
jgi:hypothetical protein